MFKSLNKVIRLLIISHFFLSSGWGLLAPVFAIFLVENIAAGSAAEGAKIAGYAALVYWVSKSILQIPISQYVDKIRGEKDDFWFMVIGTFIGVVVPFGFLFASFPWHIYALQLIWALSMAMLTPSRNAVFSRYLNKNGEAFAWGIDSTFMGLGTGICGALGGVIVSFFGFEAIFFLVGVGTFLSGILLLVTNRHIHPEDGMFPDFFPSIFVGKEDPKKSRFFKGPGGPF